MRHIHKLFGLLLLAAAPAWADDCGPLVQVNSIDLVQNHRRAMVPVTINGVSRLFLLDTGGDITQIGDAAATALDLAKTDSGIKMLDLYGHAAHRMVRVEKFGLGRQTGTNFDILVEPDPDFGKNDPFIGIFAPDMMGRYDVELNFAASKMNYFSPDHCAGRVVYWPHAALAVVPFTFRNYHIFLPVKVDGHEMRAIIDTGAPVSSMHVSVARRLFDVTDKAQGNIEIAGDNGEFGHIFDTLDFEGVSVRHPHIMVLPDMIGSKDRENDFQTGSRVNRVDDLVDMGDMLVGMDVLQKLHIYIAFGERKLYITEASPPPH